MAELNFFMTHTDTVEFAEFLTERFAATLFLDGGDSPTPPAFRDQENLEKAVIESRYAPRFFVVSDLW